MNVTVVNVKIGLEDRQEKEKIPKDIGINKRRNKMKQCKHNWHFVKEYKLPKEAFYPKSFIGKVFMMWMPVIIYDYYNVFVCDKCGDKKEVKEK